MEQQKLRELLVALHQELATVDSVDEATGGVLSTLREDIGKLVDKEHSSALATDEPLRERLSEAVNHFEAGHPRLSLAIQHLLDSLANMGF
ncbi:MAG: DUF4404 family protein [Chlorobiaceae bacterium]|nr:DUF4404 family protein [Chlorobiaceae bacterium]NTV59858.1 DUF4404 family protein [Chlorobiaceae bacterium]